MIEPMEFSGKCDPSTACRGECARCGREHVLAVGPAREAALSLFHRLERERRVDFDAPHADPRFSTEYLYGDARGQMFGVLAVRDRAGRTGVLKAFSGQYNGAWLVDGWVPPLLDVDRFREVTTGPERYIKGIGREIAALPAESQRRRILIYQRKKASADLMKTIHAMFRLPNFRDESVPLPQGVHGPAGIPTGTGDCCAPKLLGYAASNSLLPLGLAEFYFGRANRSGSRKHGQFYPSCTDKCGRILGYMLCGLEA